VRSAGSYGEGVGEEAEHQSCRSIISGESLKQTRREKISIFNGGDQNWGGTKATNRASYQPAQGGSGIRASVCGVAWCTTVDRLHRAKSTRQGRHDGLLCRSGSKRSFE